MYGRTCFLCDSIEVDNQVLSMKIDDTPDIKKIINSQEEKNYIEIFGYIYIYVF